MLQLLHGVFNQSHKAPEVLEDGDMELEFEEGK